MKSIDSEKIKDSSSKYEREERKDISKNSMLKNINKNKENIENINVKDIPKKNLTFTFNVFEIIISSFCKWYMTKELTVKKNVNNKAIELLYNKLDIVTYIRNMILLDVINETLLGHDKKIFLILFLVLFYLFIKMKNMILLNFTSIIMKMILINFIMIFLI